jgi:putative ABC transport system permease protein
MVDAFLRRLRHLVRQRQADADLRAEIEFHRYQKQQDLERAGLSAAAAAAVSLRAMGNITIAREDARAVWVWRWLDAGLRNIRHGFRVCRNSPTFALTSILTLGLCIGANAAIYTLVDWVLIRPLPFPEPERLAWVVTHAEQNGRSGDNYSQTGRAFLALADNAAAIEVGAMGATLTVNLVNGEQAMVVVQQRLSASMVGVLGMRPLLGRGFAADEDRVGGPPAVLLSYRTWIRALGGDATAIGRRVMLRGEPYTVVGVMPERFRTNTPADIWTPLRASITGEGGGDNYQVLARLRQGVTWPAAQSDIDSVGRDLYSRFPPAPGVTRRFVLASVHEAMTRELRPSLFLLWGAVVLVLLIGCVNLAGLQLARGVVRAPEIATRIAVGGGRAAIVWQLLAESAVLSIAGGVLGVAFAFGIVRVVANAVVDVLPGHIELDARVLVFTACVSLLTTFVFGLVPALKASRVDVRSMLVQGIVVDGRSHWPRRLIVISEIAMSVVLLVGAGLFVRTFDHLQNLRPGFDGRNVLTASLSLQDVRYESADRINALFDASLERIRQLPGIEAAAVALSLPYERTLNNPWRRVTDLAVQPETINLTYVTPEYFRTLRIPIVRGRAFTDRDSKNAAPVAIVNRTFAQRYQVTDEIPGYRLALDIKRPLEVVGVAEDVPQRASFRGFAPIDAIPGIFVPAAQVSNFQTIHTWFSPSWIVRSSRPAASIAPEMQQALRSVDPLLPFNRFRTVDDLRSEALLLQRAAAVLFSALAGLAILLAAIGLYGLVATSVEDRTRELGLRMALGSTPQRTLAAAVLPGAAMSAIGIAVGLVLARAGGVLVRQMVWGIPVTDLLTFLSAAAIVLTIAVVAIIIPSIRILKLNPITALRSS